MVKKVLFYKGLHEVQVKTESEGYWIVEALEDFEDYLNDEKVIVKAGETRIVQPNELFNKKTLSPPAPEHVYERRLEKRVQKMVEDYEKQEKEKQES